MSAYYNEIEPYAAQWLRNLITAGQIAPGEVDTRSIADVAPDDLRGFVQCHFFAGIGVWSYALRLAGWSDDRPVWTGSCPCQPFSAAGRGEGFADERHLWPAFHHLIAQRRPPSVFGEQVASKAVDAWIDLVQDDLEGVGYAFGAVPFPSAGVGAPHIRDRCYFVAHAAGGGREPREGHVGICVPHHGTREPAIELRTSRSFGVLADAGSAGAGRDAGTVPCAEGEGQGERRQPGRLADGDIHGGAIGLLALPEHGGREAGKQERRRSGAALPSDALGILADAALGGRREERPHVGGRAFGDREKGVPAGSFAGGGNQRPSPTNGFWRDPDWLFCRDGRWRPVEPGTFPLVDGAPARVGRLRAYGNAINAEAAAAFIASAMECLP